MAAAVFIGSVATGFFALNNLTNTDRVGELERALMEQNNALLDTQATLIALKNGQYEDEPLLGDFTPVGGLTYNLAGAGVSASANTITLTSFKAPVSGYNLSMTDFGDIGYMTLEPGNSSRQEFVSFTGVTQNANGSATLTGVSRGLAPVYPYTASTTYAKQHPGGSQASLSNSPAFYTQFGKLANDETLTGYWSVPTPLSAGDIASKSYVDSAITGTSSIAYDAQIVQGTAGETITRGQIVYFDSNTDEWMKASASVAASSTNVQLGIAQGAGTNGTSISGGVLRSGYDETQGGLTAGNTVYLSNTAGATSTTAGTISVILGQARSTGVLYFDPLYGNSAGLGFNNTFTGTNVFATSTFNGFITGATRIEQVTFNASSTWTKAAGLQYIRVQAWGGGGSGGASHSDSGNSEASGGGGGGYTEKWFLVSELGATETVTVGAGGAAIGPLSNTNTSGNNGANTTFGSLLTAYGGGLGTSGNDIGGNGGSSFSQAGGSVDAGAGGTESAGPGFGTWGGGGGGAFTDANPPIDAQAGAVSIYGGGGGGAAVRGASSPGAAGGGVSKFGGAGGAGVSSATTATATSGSAPGGGGGAAAVRGAGQTATSGAGGTGRVIVTEFY